MAKNALSSLDRTKHNYLMTIVLLLSVVVLVALYFWFYRWIFIYSFNYTQAADKVGHSQWRIPQSTRMISDDQLYPFAGYELVLGKKFTQLTAEVPPFAKLLYGVAIATTGNPYVTTVIFFLLSLVLVYKLARTTGLGTQASIATVIILLTNQLFFSQLGQTMLDIILMALLLINTICLLKSFEVSGKRSTIYLTCSGIALGLFAASKFPLYAGIILSIECFWLIYKARSIRSVKPFILVFATGTAYFLSYIFLAIGESTVIELLQVQFWMIHFYAIGKVDTQPLQTIQRLLSGGYFVPNSGLVSLGANEWSIWWLASYISSIILVIKHRANDGIKFLSIIFLTLSLLMIFTPFLNRYFLILLPIGIILTMHALKLIASVLVKRSLLGLLIGVSIFQAGLFLVAEPYTKLVFSAESWNNANYQDFYSYLAKPTMSQKDFSLTMRKRDADAHIIRRTMTLAAPSLSDLMKKEYGLSATLSYDHILGFTTMQSGELDVIDVHGQSRLMWSDLLSRDAVPAECGEKQKSDSNILTYIVVSKSAQDVESIIKQLGEITALPEVDFRNQIFLKQSDLEFARIPVEIPLTAKQLRAIDEIPDAELNIYENTEVLSELCKPN